MTEWKPTEQNIGEPVKSDYVVSSSPSLYLHRSKLSNWTCYLFGGSLGDGISWTPHEGRVPNRFVRWMMKLCFACTWVENK